jgi:hypothetical protein
LPGLSLTITHCTARGFSIGIGTHGVLFTGGVDFLIADTVVTNNGFGIQGSLAVGSLDHVVVYKNTVGIVFGHTSVTVVDTIVGSKLALIVAMLTKDKGATLAALVEATGWLPPQRPQARIFFRSCG